MNSECKKFVWKKATLIVSTSHLKLRACSRPHSLYYTGVYAIFLVRCVTVNRKVKWNNLKPSRSGSKTVHTFQGARVPCANIVGMYTERRDIRNSILRQDRDDIIGNCTGPEEEKANIDSSNVPSVSVRVGARGGYVDTRVRCYWHSGDKSCRTPPAYILIILLYT